MCCIGKRSDMTHHSWAN